MNILQTKKSKEKLRKCRKGQTTSKSKVKVGMLEVALEGENVWRRKRMTKSMEVGKHKTCYRRGMGLVRLEHELHEKQ